ncbi:MAG: hypothetical protein JJU42_14930, partial [Rhodobacteraceae bacterium]|nr:hypothetical protein [Paracoccaceae bacterium]
MQNTAAAPPDLTSPRSLIRAALLVLAVTLLAAPSAVPPESAARAAASVVSDGAGGCGDATPHDTDTPARHTPGARSAGTGRTKARQGADAPTARPRCRWPAPPAPAGGGGGGGGGG